MSASTISSGSGTIPPKRPKCATGTKPFTARRTSSTICPALHTRSGLINEWENGLSVEEAERKVTEYVSRFTPDGVKPLLAGNSIGSDKKFLDRYMPNLMEHLHYRVIDVSTLKELARRWYPAVYNNRPPKNGGHRALADIIESLDELRYYRKAFMAAAPGPDAAEAKAIADQIVATSILNNN